MKKCTVLFFGLFFILLQAQDSISREIITTSYDKDNLEGLIKQMKIKHHNDSIKIRAYVKKNKIDSVRAKNIYSIAEDGMPVMFNTNDMNQINATNVNMVINNNTSGLDLTGSGVTAYVYDEGDILTTHQEFEGRVANVSGTGITGHHPTWVAGVIAAKGIYENARGMANKISVVGDHYYNQSNIAEIANAGAILSNHSYGFRAGWYWNSVNSRWEWWGNNSISVLEDYKFGYYSREDSDIDKIPFNAPYHTMVKASANSNNIIPPSGTNYLNIYDNKTYNINTNPRNKNCLTGFDCIPMGSLGKNIITVGAVQTMGHYYQPSDVVLASYSSVGPTDDGRIKPDVVAIGSDVVSTNASGSYSTISGTSFSTPSVSGIVALVQELFQSKKGSYMRSDLVKALLIHTANEAGATEGPDYKFGWGLVDAYKASQTILNEGTTTYINQSILNNGGNCSMEISATGVSKIKATLVWIDRQATAISQNVLNNRTKTLLNDLDIKIIDKDNPENIYLPWKLDVNNPTSAATKGDNTIDNVEQVEFTPANTSGSYYISLTHKGTLTDPINYSLIINSKPITQCSNSSTENELSIHLLVYDQLYITYPLSNTKNEYDLYIYDYSGKLVSKTTETGYKVDIKSLNLSPSTYIAVVKSGGQVASTKFVVK